MIRRLPVVVQRVGYRVAYAVLVAGSLLLRPHTRGVKCAVVLGGEVLLVRHAYGSRRWDLPGGFVRRREAFGDAVRREVREELGVAVGVWVELGELRRRNGGRHETLRLYRVEVSSRAIVVDPVEIAEARWFQIASLPPDRSELIAQALP